MSASRKGLKRHGMGAYRVGRFIVRRLGARKWAVRHTSAPDLATDFFAILFRRLRDARKWAEGQ